jgi:hypothetical protein
MEFYELKNRIIDTGKEVHFFDPDTLKFFGETLSGMRLLKGIHVISDISGVKHDCYCVAVTRRKNAFGPCKPYTFYHYFDAKTFRHVIR